MYFLLSKLKLHTISYSLNRMGSSSVTVHSSRVHRDTGKTEVLSHDVSHHLLDQVFPGLILAFAFL